MTTPEIANLPAQYQEGVALLVGLIASGIVYVLTALAKHFGKTSGITTVTVSAVLSALIAGGLGYSQGLYGHGTAALLPALLAAVTAFVGANGQYIGKVQAAQKAQATAAQSGLERI
jgi:hypothetical protein